jgi:hypothetical protein
MPTKTKKATRMVITIPAFLKSQLETTAHKLECSQALVLRTAFIRMMEADR